MSWTVERIRKAVEDAVEMRPPKFDLSTAPSEKIGILEDYLLKSAWQRSELEEALFRLDHMIDVFKAKIEAMTGYEVALPPKRSERITKEDVLRAKRTLDPVTFDVGAECRLLRATAIRQVVRFQDEYHVVSRAYTLITGS